MRTKKVKHYQIEGLSTIFDSLSAAKRHFEFYTMREKISEIGTCIFGFDYSGNCATYCYLRRVGRNGRLYFSKSFSCMN